MAIRVGYNEPKFNQQNGSIGRRVPRDWSKRIHNVNIVPRLNLLHCTYCHQIGHHINECPFIEDNVNQGFVEHPQNLNQELAKADNHRHVEPEDLYHKGSKFHIDLDNRFREITKWK